MSTTSRPPRCPRCGTQQSKESTLGVCPRCLIGIGLDNSLDGPEEEETVASSSGVGSPGAAPTEIGSYRLLHQLGEGGMGVVYLAEQTEPIRRQVALKLIKLGMDTSRVIARFETERHTLALMNHPNIARVHDAGITREGRPYFVMEYIDGVPITDYCDDENLGLRRRLQLFEQTCEAIQHAHQKGIIHRDVKPSNVMVTMEGGRATVKVIDFGIARATERDVSAATRLTRHDALIGTPEFMSPEQAGGTQHDVDTRTDVYSLGMLLYQLLAGDLPFDTEKLRAAAPDEIRRRIREDEPLRPSARVSMRGGAAPAARRPTDPGLLRRRLTGDLDWITMKALEKDPARRYASPSEIVADIRRYLTQQPVLAGPPGAAYRMRKFIRRHRLSVVAASVLLALLVVFAATMTVQARRIARERDRASRAAEAATQVSSFLVDLFEVSDPSEARGNTIPAREILDRGAEKIERELTGQPQVQARLMATIGTVYKKLGLYADAEPLLARSQTIGNASLGKDHPDSIGTTLEIGELRFLQGRLEEAEAELRDAYERSSRVLGDEHLDTMSALGDLAVVLHFQGRLEEAEVQYRQAHELRLRVLGIDHPDTLETTNNLAALFYSQGKLDEAEPYFREALEGRRARFGNDHPETLDSLSNLAVVLQSQGRLDEAEMISRETVEINQRVRPDHPSTLVSINNLGMLLQGQGKLDEAGELYREAVVTLRSKLGEDHLHTLTTMGNLGDLYTTQGRLTEAGELLVPALAAVERTLPRDNAVTGYTLLKYGRWLAHSEQYAEAEENLLEAEAILQATVGDTHAHTRSAYKALAEMYEAMGEEEKAAAWREKS